MFCPQCGSNQSDDVKFCKSCGANLFAVRQAVATREPTHETSGKFDWSKTWVAEMMLSESEREKRKEELERQRGITPESRSHKEIKAGVITTSVGVALAIFLFVFMQGIIVGGNVDKDAAAILSRLWIVGVIPFFVGLGLLVNGLFVKSAGQASTKTGALEGEAQPPLLPEGDASAFTPSPSSVTEHTTRQLRDSDTQRP
jgi:hypothetical protein